MNSKSDTIDAEIREFLDHLVFKEGKGPNGSGGEIRYWKNDVDIPAEEALLSLLLRERQKELQDIADNHGEMGVTKRFLYDRIKELSRLSEEPTHESNKGKEGEDER